MAGINRDWKEKWVDQMGLIVALSGYQRYERIRQFKEAEAKLTPEQKAELRECIRQRFTPSNGNDGCKEATASVREVTR